MPWKVNEDVWHKLDKSAWFFLDSPTKAYLPAVWRLVKKSFMQSSFFRFMSHITVIIPSHQISFPSCKRTSACMGHPWGIVISQLYRTKNTTVSMETKSQAVVAQGTTAVQDEGSTLHTTCSAMESLCGITWKQASEMWRVKRSNLKHIYTEFCFRSPGLARLPVKFKPVCNSGTLCVPFWYPGQIKSNTDIWNR